MTKIIQDYDFRYTLGRKLSNIVMRLYHREIWVSGTENIPKNTPVVFGPNHQNALIDALALIYAVPGQPVFLARADIFQKGFLRWAFRGMKILPVYRIRDGKDNLANNDGVFDEAKGVLVDKKFLALFPEASHNPLRRLLPLKKGIPRIVFLTEQDHNFELGTVVVPVGIYYSDTDHFDETLQIQFGKPIPVGQFKELFDKNPQKAHIELRDAMAEGMRPLMIDIRDKEYYEMYELLRYLYNRPMRQRLGLKNRKQPDRFRADKAIINMIDDHTTDNPELKEELNIKTSRINEILARHHMEPREFYPSVKKILAPLRAITGILLFPFFAYGGINHIFPIFIGMYVSKKIPDPQFISSIKFGVGLFLTPLFYIIQFFVFQAFVHNWLISLAYLVSLPVSFILFKHARRYYKTTQKLRKTHILRRRYSAEWEEVRSLTDELKEILNKMSPRQ